MKPAYNTSTDPWEERAEKVLSHFNIRYPDEIDIDYICWKYGMTIMPLAEPFLEPYYEGTIDEGIKSFSIPNGKGRRGTIFLKEGLDPIERRILLAEEFAHLYSHNLNQLDTHWLQISKSELQAKRMAAYLLMPSRFIGELIEDFYDDEAILISDIADTFLVTEEFVHFRLELLFKHRVDLIIKHKNGMGTIEWFE